MSNYTQTLKRMEDNHQKILDFLELLKNSSGEKHLEYVNTVSNIFDKNKRSQSNNYVGSSGTNYDPLTSNKNCSNVKYIGGNDTNLSRNVSSGNGIVYGLTLC